MLEHKITTAVQDLIYRKPAPAVVDTYVRPSLLEENGEHRTRPSLAAELKADEEAETKAEAKTEEKPADKAEAKA